MYSRKPRRRHLSWNRLWQRECIEDTSSCTRSFKRDAASNDDGIVLSRVARRRQFDGQVSAALTLQFVVSICHLSSLFYLTLAVLLSSIHQQTMYQITGYPEWLAAISLPDTVTCVCVCVSLTTTRTVFPFPTSVSQLLSLFHYLLSLVCLLQIH